MRSNGEGDTDLRLRKEGTWCGASPGQFQSAVAPAARTERVTAGPLSMWPTPAQETGLAPPSGERGRAWAASAFGLRPASARHAPSSTARAAQARDVPPRSYRPTL